MGFNVTTPPAGSTQIDPSTGDAANLLGKDIESPDRKPQGPLPDKRPDPRAPAGAQRQQAAPVRGAAGDNKSGGVETQVAIALGPDGKPLVGPDGKPVLVALGADGKPLLGADGKPMLLTTGPDGAPVPLNADAKGLNLTAIAAPVTDSIDNRTSLSVLAQLMPSVQGREGDPKGDLSEVRVLFQSLEPLLGVPSGDRVAESFQFDFVPMFGELPASSPELLNLVGALRDADPSNQPTAAEAQPSVGNSLNVSELPFAKQNATPTLRLAAVPEGETPSTNAPAGETTLTPHEQLAQIVEEQFYKVGDTVPEKILGTYPPAIQKTLEAQIPVLQKAMRLSGKNVDPQNPDVVILTREEVEAEQRDVQSAFGPLVDTSLRLAARVANTDPGALRQAVAAMKQGKTTGNKDVDALARDLVPVTGSIERSLGGLDFINGDVMSLVTVVMMQCAKTNADILRDIMKELQKANAEKAAQRQKIAAMKEGKAKAETAARDEFAVGQQNGSIDPSWSLDDYMEVRKVAWGDGVSDNGVWKGPSPELPPLSETMRLRFAQPKVKPATAAGADADVSKEAKMFGLSDSQANALHKIYDTEPVKSQRGETDFMTWLSKTVGLKQVKTADDIVPNCVAIEKFIKAQPAQKPAEAAPAAPVEAVKPPGGYANLNDVKNVAIEYAYQECVRPALQVGDQRNEESINNQRNLADWVSKLSPEDRKAYDEWKLKVLPTVLGNLGRDLLDTRGKIQQHVRDHWEGSNDRDVKGGFQIVNGDIQLEVYDDEELDEFNGYLSYRDMPIGPDNGCHGFEGDINVYAGAWGDRGPNEWQTAGFHPGAGAMWKLMWWKPQGTIDNKMIDDAAWKLQNCGDILGNPTMNPGAWQPPAPEANAPPPPPPGIPQAQLDSWTDLNQSDMASVKQILDTKPGTPGRNKNGEFYDCPPSCDPVTYDRLKSQGLIKLGKSDDDIAIEGQRQAANVDANAEFAKHANEVKLNHVGSFAELQAAIEGEEGKLDTMGDMTQLMQMRLQKYLDAYSKMFEMLSNALKKIAQTSDNMAQNIK